MGKRKTASTPKRARGGKNDIAEFTKTEKG